MVIKLNTLGRYVGDVTVYFIAMPDGSLRSNHNAEEPPPENIIPKGTRVVKSESNPKIILDSGDTVYGCQVWWSPVDDDFVEVECQTDHDPWARSAN